MKKIKITLSMICLLVLVSTSLFLVGCNKNKNFIDISCPTTDYLENFVLGKAIAVCVGSSPSNLRYNFKTEVEKMNFITNSIESNSYLIKSVSNIDTQYYFLYYNKTLFMISSTKGEVSFNFISAFSGVFKNEETSLISALFPDYSISEKVVGESFSKYSNMEFFRDKNNEEFRNFEWFASLLESTKSNNFIIDREAKTIKQKCFVREEKDTRDTLVFSTDYLITLDFNDDSGIKTIAN